jgi:hypothetical protein
MQTLPFTQDDNLDITPKLPKKSGILLSVRIFDMRNVSAGFPTMMCFTCFSIYFIHLFFLLVCHLHFILHNLCIPLL